MNRGRRFGAIAAVLALFATGVLTDQLVGFNRGANAAIGATGATTHNAAASSPRLPSLSSDGALSSTWFCPATTSVDNGLADGAVIIGNPTPTAITGSITVVPSAGAPKDVPFRVGPRDRMSIRPGDYVSAPYTAALVQLDGPNGAVEQQIRGGLGESTTPCSTHASDRWYFAAGSTDTDSQLLLSLFNPFPGDAVVDLSFATDIGPSSPADLQGLIVPARGVLVVDVGDHVRRRTAVATSVAVRSGRIVADKIQLRGAAGSIPKGVTLSLGVPATGSQWYFPDGVADAGVDERYELYNPSDRASDVSVQLRLDRGLAVPFLMTVGPHERLTLAVNGETRIPHGTAHSGVVTTTNGVGIVVERVITSSPPSPHLGISDLTGSPYASAHWVVVAGAANSVQDEWLVAYNPANLANLAKPGSAPTKLSVTASVGGQPLAVEGLQNVKLAPGERVAIRLGDHLAQSDLMVVVDSSSPIVVERDLYQVGAVGVSASLGVPAS